MMPWIQCCTRCIIGTKENIKELCISNAICHAIKCIISTLISLQTPQMPVCVVTTHVKRGKENHFILLGHCRMLAAEVNSLHALPRAITTSTTQAGHSTQAAGVQGNMTTQTLVSFASVDYITSALIVIDVREVCPPPSVESC
jgi:hypothetical protein